MPIDYLHVVFGKMSVQCSTHFFFFVLIKFVSMCAYVCVLSCMSCLYTLNINPLLVVSFADIFSHSVGCLFMLLMISFSVQKLLV